MSLKNNIKKIQIPSLRKTFLGLFFIFFAFTVSGQTSYIKKYRPLADSLSEHYGIPASVILGIAILESGSGTSRNSKLLNNHFGIVGKNNLQKTKGIKSRYKQFKHVRDSYVAFCKIQTRRNFYLKLKGNKDYNLWIDAMSKSNYSEVPDIWKSRVTAIIKQNKLSR